MRSQAQARTWLGDWALNAELTTLMSCVPQYADSECWGVLCQPKPGLAVAEWTKCMGMVTPVIGSSLHLGSWQYKTYNNFGFYSIECVNCITYSLFPPNGIFFIDVSNLSCFILMTIEISTGQHREMLHRRMFLWDDCWSPQCRAPHECYEEIIQKYNKLDFIPLSGTDCCTRRIFSHWRVQLLVPS